jgi:hypothetical protein
MASESGSSAGAGRPDPTVEAGSEEPHIGSYLAGQRKLRGISRQELAELTRIPIRSLERLETGHFDGIDDGFVRGFVRTVSAALGLDPEDALTRMIPEPVGSGESPILGHVALGRLLLLVGALVVVAGSVGIVSAVIRPAPERAGEPEQGLRRRDPVRALALAEGAVGVPGEVVLAASVERDSDPSASGSASVPASASGSAPDRVSASAPPAAPDPAREDPANPPAAAGSDASATAGSDGSGEAPPPLN